MFINFLAIFSLGAGAGNNLKSRVILFWDKYVYNMFLKVKPHIREQESKLGTRLETRRL